MQWTVDWLSPLLVSRGFARNLEKIIILSLHAVQLLTLRVNFEQIGWVFSLYCRVKDNYCKILGIKILRDWWSYKQHILITLQSELVFNNKSAICKYCKYLILYPKEINFHFVSKVLPTLNIVAQYRSGKAHSFLLLFVL